MQYSNLRHALLEHENSTNNMDPRIHPEATETIHCVSEEENQDASEECDSDSSSDQDSISPVFPANGKFVFAITKKARTAEEMTVTLQSRRANLSFERLPWNKEGRIVYAEIQIWSSQLIGDSGRFKVKLELDQKVVTKKYKAISGNFQYLFGLEKCLDPKTELVVYGILILKAKRYQTELQNLFHQCLTYYKVPQFKSREGEQGDLMLDSLIRYIFGFKRLNPTLAFYLLSFYEILGISQEEKLETKTELVNLAMQDISNLMEATPDPIAAFAVETIMATAVRTRTALVNWNEFLQRIQESAVYPKCADILFKNIGSFTTEELKFVKRVIKIDTLEMARHVLKAVSDMRAFIEALGIIFSNINGEIYRQLVPELNLSVSILVENPDFTREDVRSLLLNSSDRVQAYIKLTPLKSVLVAATPRFPVSESEQTVPIYILFPVSQLPKTPLLETMRKNETKSIPLSQFQLVPWTGSYQEILNNVVWKVGCPAKEDGELLIKIQREDGTLGNQIGGEEKRCISKFKTAHFIFELKFESPTYTYKGETSITDPMTQIFTYAAHVFQLANSTDAFVDLLVQFSLAYPRQISEEEMAFLYGRLKTLVTEQSVKISKEFGYNILLMLDKFPIPNTIIDLYFGFFLEHGLEMLNSTVEMLLHVSVETAQCVSRGYVKLMSYCVTNKSIHWIKVFQLVKITPYNKVILSNFYKSISATNVSYLLDELMKHQNDYEFSQLELLLTRITILEDYLRLLYLMSTNPHVSWTKTQLVESLNSVVGRSQALSFTQFNSIVTELLSREVSVFLNIVGESSLIVQFQPLLKAPANISSTHIPLYQLLFRKGSVLIPDLDQKQFIFQLVHVYQFPLRETYEHFKEIFGKFEAFFQYWVEHVMEASPLKKLELIDREIAKIAAEEYAERCAEKAVESVFEMTRKTEFEFLDLLSSSSFSCKIVFDSYVSKLRYFVDEYMKFNTSIVSNELLRHLFSMKYEASYERIIDALLNQAISQVPPLSQEEIIKALVESPEKQSYWIELFQLYSETSPTVLTCLIECSEFGVRLTQGNIAIGQLAAVKQSPHLEELTVIVDHAMSLRNSTSSKITDSLSLWTNHANDSAAKAKYLIEFIEANFPEITDLVEINRFVPERNPTYSQELASTLEFPIDLQNIFAFVETIFYLSNSAIFTGFLQRRKALIPRIRLDHIQPLINEALAEMRLQLDNISDDFENVKISEIIKIFQNIRDLNTEFDILNKFFGDPEKCAKLRKGLDSVLQITRLAELSEAILELEKVVKFSCQPALTACRTFLELSRVSTNLYIQELLDASENLARQISSIMANPVISNIVLYIRKHAALVKYLYEIPDDILTMLNEVAATMTQVTLDPETIQCFESVKYFVKQIARASDVPALTLKISELIQDRRYQKFEEMLEKCNVKLRLLQEAQDNLTSLEQGKMDWIAKVLASSTVVFSQSEHNSSFTIKIKSEKLPLSFDEINELNSRCCLIIHSADHGFEVEMIAQLKSFTLLFQLLHSISSKYQELQHIGAPLFLIGQSSCEIVNSESRTAEQLASSLETQITTWKQTIKDTLSRSYYLSYIYGRHLWLLESYFLNNSKLNKAETAEARSWLRYMRLDSDRRATSKITQTLLANRLQKLEVILAGQPKMQKVQAQRRQSLNKIPFLMYGKGDIVYLESPKNDIALISMYCNSGREFPDPDHVMFCRASTEKCEVEAFLYHCFYSREKNQFFAMVNCELLLAAVQIEAINILQDLSGLDSIAHLVVISRTADCPFSEFLSDPKRQYVQYFNKEKMIKNIEELKKCVQDISPTVTLVTSDIAGLGKTTWVQRQAANSHKELAIFHISGDLDIDEMCKALCNLILSDKMPLLMQISYIEGSSQATLEEVLLQLILLKAIKTNEHFFLLPEYCELYIEVANTSSKPMIISDTILRMVKQVNFAKVDMSEFIIGEKEVFVLNYLSEYSRDPNSLVNKIDGTAPISPEQCADLLHVYFIAVCEQRGDAVSYRSIHTFISVLWNQITNLKDSIFSTSIPRNASNIQRGDFPDLALLRPQMMALMLKSTEEYTTKSIKQVHQHQNQALKADEPEANQPGVVNCAISWKESNHVNLILNEKNNFILIYKDLNLVSQDFKNLILSQAEILANYDKNPEPALPDYAAMDHTALLEKLTSTYCTARVVYRSDYILTPDNFLKMNLIYVRASSGIPIIIMGDTGCGKTSLIKYFAEKVLGEFLEIIDVHAGTTAALLVEKMNQLKQQYLKSKRLWIFFDEFNTSSCVGMISEMVCDRRLNGQPLPDNLVLVAACNPYRIKPKAMSFGENVGLKRKHNASETAKLLHVVKPLPESMIEYVWDFGALTPEDTVIYIKAILKDKKVRAAELFTKAIAVAHNFFTVNEDVSSVSLRDVRRFTILYRWFADILARKEALTETGQRYQQNSEKLKLQRVSHPYPLQERAGFLALYLCYIVRIANVDLRRQLITDLFPGDSNRAKAFQAVVEYEQIDLLARMEISDDIAINVAFRENVFTLFNCIFNNIPVILCGKPGCSKSLSYQLIYENCQNIKSIDPFFKTLPAVRLVYFQGSETCTSEAVLKSFERARRFLTLQNIKPVIVFDEIGLAEVSRFNPLKVLHKELELDMRDQGAAFIGISNWRLDASKMNRVLFLSRPDPDIEELKFTALSIFNSRLPGRIYEDAIKRVTTAYADLKKSALTKPTEDFYGLRDFYHLIKQIANSFAIRKPQNPAEIVQVVNKAIARNFGVKAKSNEVIWSKFAQYYPGVAESHFEPYDVCTLIQENLSDRDARYLMLISNGDLGESVLDKVMQINVEKMELMIGSTLELDQEGDTYGLRCLSDIILYMEKGIPIILKDMDQIYSSLYDLFNQNYGKSGLKNYCRIALGESFNPRCIIHENFRVIVLVNGTKENTHEKDAALLNRFEKHTFKMECLLDSRMKELAQTMSQWVSALILPKRKKILLDSTHIFPTYTLSAMQLIVRSMIESQHDTDEVALAALKRHLIATAPADLLVLASLSELPDSSFIQQTWRELHRDTFLQVINSKQQNTLHVIFTYENEKQTFRLPDVETVVIRHLSAFKSEESLTTDLKQFSQDSGKLLYAITLDFTVERTHFAFLKYVLEKEEKRYSRLRPTVSKKFCIIVSMQRNVKYDTVGLDYTRWSVRMIDLLQGPPFEISDEMLQMNIGALVLQYTNDEFEKLLEFSILKILLQFTYTPGPNIKEKTDINAHLFLIAENITKSDGLISALRKSVMRYLEHSKLMDKDWKSMIFEDPECVNRSRGVHAAIVHSMEQTIQKALTIVMFSIEKVMAMRSFFVNWTIPSGELIREIWLSVFADLHIDSEMQSQVLPQSTIIEFNYELDFPFILIDSSLIQELDNDSFDSFLVSYRSKSVIRNYFMDIKNYRSLQQLYFRDLVRIHISKKLLMDNVEEVYFILVWHLISQLDTHESCVYAYLQNQELIALYCRYVQLFADVLGSKTIQNLYSTLLPPGVERNFLTSDSLQGKPALSKIRDEFRSQPQSDNSRAKQDQGNIASIETSVSSFKALLVTMLNASVPLLYPNNKSLQSRSISAWRNSLIQCEKVLLQFSKMGIELQCIKPLQIMNRFAMMINTQQEVKFLVELYEVLKKQGNSGSLTEDKATINKIFKLCDAYERIAPARAYQFKSYYYSELLDKELESLEQFVSDVNGKPEFWKYSSAAMNKIFENSGLSVIWRRILEFPELDAFPTSPFLNKLERLLENSIGENRFGVLLSDLCVSHISKSKTTNVFTSYVSLLKPCETVINRTDLPFRCTKRLVAFSFLKWFLAEYYSPLLLNPDLYRDRSQESLTMIENMLMSSSHSETLKLYCLKIMKYVKNLSMTRLLEIKRSNLNLAWIQSVDYLQLSAPKDCYFVDPNNMKHFIKVSELLEMLSNSEHQENQASSITRLDTLIDEYKSADDKLQFGLAFLAQVFTKHHTGANLQPVAAWFNHRKTTLQKNFGTIMTELLERLVFNFPAHERFQLRAGMPLEEKQRVLVVSALLVTISAYSRVPGCLTSIFFDASGELSQTSIQSSRSLYVVGLEQEPLYEYLYDLYTNFHKYKLTSMNMCGSSCNYIYSLGDCGRPTEIYKCPYCGSKIGGTSHILVARAGHQQITDEEAKRIAIERVTVYKAKQSPGFVAYEGIFIPEAAGMRDISPMTYRVLHFMLSNYLCFLNSVFPHRVAEMVTLMKLRSLDEYFKIILPSDENEIYRVLDSQDSYIWMFKVISGLPEFLHCHQDIPRTATMRTKFETDFDAKLVKPNLASVTQTIQEYKASRSQKESVQQRYLDEGAGQDTFPHIQYFRLVRTPSFSILRNTLDRLSGQNELTIIRLFVQKQEDIGRIQGLRILVELTNYLFAKYKHKITRDEARERPVSSIQDHAFKSLLQKFLGFWVRIGDLQYECHPLPRIEFTQDMPLIYFLLDNKELGGGMYLAAAIKSLAEGHNNLLRAVAKGLAAQRGVTEEEVLDPKQYPVQQASSECFTSINLDDQTLLQSYSTNNPVYGRGQEVAFDFDRLEQALCSNFEQMKLLEFENLHFFQYQFELLQGENSSTIIDIRKAIPQSELPNNVKRGLIVMLDKKEKNAPDTFPLFLREILGGMDSLLCIVKNEKLESNTSLQTICVKFNLMKVCEALLSTSEISSMEVRNIVALYEFLEERCFPFVKRFIKTDFNQRDKSGKVQGIVSRFMNNCIKMSQNYPSLTEVKVALMKFIMRCLLTGELKNDAKIGMYLVKEDLWREDIGDVKLESVENGLHEVELQYTLQVYKICAGGSDARKKRFRCRLIK